MTSMSSQRARSRSHQTIKGRARCVAAASGALLAAALMLVLVAIVHAPASQADDALGTQTLSLSIEASPVRQGGEVKLSGFAPHTAASTTSSTGASPTTTGATTTTRSSTTTTAATTTTSGGSTTTTQVGQGQQPANCAAVALESLAFNGSGSTGDPASVVTPVNDNGSFAVNVSLSDNVSVGTYSVAAKCASPSAATPFATTNFIVASVLPLDNKTHAKQQWIAFACVAALCGLILFLLRGKKVFAGFDNRVSTSKTIAILWTPVVAYIVLTLSFIAVASDQFGLWHILEGSPVAIYLALLGGPFAGAVGAKAIVQTRSNAKKLQKPPAANPTLGDLFQDDQGQLDVVDTQYVLFNVIAIVAVLSQFLARPGFGAPDIPAFLAALTGLSSATYLTNKAVTSTNDPSIEKVQPTIARIGAQVAVFGSNLLSATGTEEPTTVTVGGYAATDVEASANNIKFRVPQPVNPANFEGLTHPIEVTTVGGFVVPANDQVSVVPDSYRFDGLRPPRLARAGAFTVRGFDLFPAIDTLYDGRCTPDAESPVAITAVPAADADPVAAPAPENVCPLADDAPHTNQQITVTLPEGTPAGDYDVWVRGNRTNQQVEVR